MSQYVLKAQCGQSRAFLLAAGYMWKSEPQWPVWQSSKSHRAPAETSHTVLDFRAG